MPDSKQSTPAAPLSPTSLSAPTTLSSPTTLSGLKLQSRWAMAPMTRRQSPGGIPTAEVAAYYKRRAQGRVGLIITEGVLINENAGGPGIPNLYDTAALAGWKEVVDAVHAAGGAIAPQLWHQGSNHPGGVGPSPVANPGFPGDASAAIPTPLTEEDVAAIADDFAQAGAYAKALGFDAVEIHGAHGYLIDQFFWAETNQRPDAYGQERHRFAVEVIQKLRANVGPDFPILFRFSQWKLGAYDAQLCASPKDLEAFLRPLTDAGVDIFHPSTRRWWQPAFEGEERNLAAFTKALSGKPTILVGSVGLDLPFTERQATQGTSLDSLHAAIDRGDADLVAVGRALLADPNWVHLANQGRHHEARPFTPELREVLT